MRPRACWKGLADQAAITVSVAQVGAPVAVPSLSGTCFDKAAHDAWSIFSGGLHGLLAASGAIVLVLLLLALVAIGGRIGSGSCGDA